VKEFKFFELSELAHQFFHVNQWKRNSSIANHTKLDLYLRGESEESKFALAFSTLGDFDNGYHLVRFSPHSVISKNVICTKVSDLSNKYFRSSLSVSLQKKKCSPTTNRITPH